MGGHPVAGRRRVVLADVEQVHGAARGPHGFREAAGERGPVEGRRTVDREHQRAGRQTRGRAGQPTATSPATGR